MLQKKLGVRKNHLMKIINLVEANFTTRLNIMVAQILMWTAEALGIFPDQWGGRANRSAPG